MKKLLYILLLAAEAFAGLIMMGLVYSNIGWLAALIPPLIAAALLIPRIRRLKEAEDPAAGKKLRRQIALITLIPALTGLILALYVLISLMIYYG